MKKSIIFFSLFFSTILTAQNSEFARPFLTSQKATYSLKNQQINVSPTSSSVVDLYNRLKIKSVNLKNGDLVVNYDLSDFTKAEKDMKMLLELAIYDPATKRKVYALGKNLEGITAISSSAKDKPNQLVWRNWVEEIKPLSEDITFHLDGNLVGPSPINCDRPPVWGINQKLPHYLAGGVGLGMVIASLPIRKNSDELYEQYVDESFGQDGNALGTYSNANNKHKTANFLIVGGLSVLAADALTYWIRYSIFKRNKKNFEYYCQEKPKGFSFQPIIEIDNSLTDKVGVQLNYTF